MRKIAATSPTPNQRIEIGIHARGEIGRSSWRIGLRACSPRRYQPSRRPSGIAVNSGLGFLIVDARNAGNRYDLVVAGMVMIGLIGLALDTAIRQLERLKALRWGYGS